MIFRCREAFAALALLAVAGAAPAFAAGSEGGAIDRKPPAFTGPAAPPPAAASGHPARTRPARSRAARAPAQNR